jgi:hypothetical protein
MPCLATVFTVAGRGVRIPVVRLVAAEGEFGGHLEANEALEYLLCYRVESSNARAKSSNAVILAQPESLYWLFAFAIFTFEDSALEYAVGEFRFVTTLG